MDTKRLEKDIVFPLQLAGDVADHLMGAVDASYKNMASVPRLFPLYAGEAELEGAADAARNLMESARALRGVMLALLEARREQEEEEKAAVN